MMSSLSIVKTKMRFLQEYPFKIDKFVPSLQLFPILHEHHLVILRGTNLFKNQMILDELKQRYSYSIESVFEVANEFSFQSSEQQSFQGLIVLEKNGITNLLYLNALPPASDCKQLYRVH